MNSFTKRLHRLFTPLPVRQRGRLIIAIPITCLFTALAAFAWLKTSLVEDDIQIQQAQNVQIETKQLLTAVLNAEAAMQGYGLTQRPEFLQDYQEALAAIEDTLADLDPLIQDNPQQVTRLAEIRLLIDQSLAAMQQKLTLQPDLKKVNGSPELVIPIARLYNWLEQGKATFDQTYTQIDLFAQAEDRSLEDRKQHQDLYRQLTWATLCLSALIGTGGGLLALALFHQLERELAAQQVNLQQSNQQLEQACEQLQRFTANASHELRAPLAAMLSNAQVALVEFEDEPEISRQRLNKIVELTKSMSTLVSNLLFLSRQDGTLKNEVFRSTELVDLLHSLTEAWETQATPQSIDLKLQLPAPPIVVNADPDLLRQAILNLLHNAYRYSKAEGTVELRLSTQAERAVIEVIDCGIGIPETDLQHIFERFYRVDKSRNRAKGGFGLGLAIVQQIVQAHGGTITATSAIDCGSTFRISLPLSSG
jgi:signal transduction histidine kinase